MCRVLLHLNIIIRSFGSAFYEMRSTTENEENLTVLLLAYQFNAVYIIVSSTTKLSWSRSNLTSITHS